MSRRFALFLFAWLGLLGSARAHDPFLAEIEADAGSTGLVLRVVMTRSVAAHLAGLAAAPRLYFAAADFPAHKTEFARLAPGLCALRANEIELAPLHSEVALAPDGQDIVFTLSYPRPATDSIRVESLWLPRLPEGYAALLHFRADAKTPPSAPILLQREQPAGDLTLPPASAGLSPDRPAVLLGSQP